MKRCLICNRDRSRHQDFYHWIHSDTLLCGDCQLQLNPVETVRMLDDMKVHILYEYNGFLENLLFQYKEGQDVALRQMFFWDYRHQIRKQFKGRTILLMPSSEAKNRERGFHALKEMSAVIHLPTLQPFRKRSDHKQSLLSYEQRQHISKFMDWQLDAEFSKRKVLLVDDVVTTGATLRAAYKLLPQSIKKAEALVCCAHPLFLKQQPRTHAAFLNRR